LAKNKKINAASKTALQEQVITGKISEIMLKNSNPEVIATKIAKLVTKDLGQNINTTYSASNTPFSSPNSASPQISVVPTAVSGTSLASVSAWPSPKLWYQQGDEVAKKAYNEYLNALNLYLNCPPEQFERKMEEAGKMNALIQSMVQGLSIGLEGAEDIQRRTRAGDTAAPIEMNVVKNTMEKMLKTIWVHNTAAASAKMAGLEVKLLESQMVSRISKAIGVPLTDYGIQLQSADDADRIWMMEPEMPPEIAGLQQEDVPGGEVGETPMTEGEEDVSPEEFVDPEEEINAPENEEVPLDDDVLKDENGNVIGEDVPTDTEVDNLQETPMEDVDTIAEEEVPEEEIVEEEPGSAVLDTELADEGEVPAEEEFPNDDEPIDEEGFVDEEVVPEETTDEFPEDTEPVDEEGFVTDEEVPDEEEVVDEEEVPVEEEVVDEEPVEEEVVDEEEPVEEEVVDEEEVPLDEEEEAVYCIMCDQMVTPSEIEACEEENCPFKNVVGADDEEEVDKGDDEEPTDEEDVEEKHFVLLDQEDHTEHKVYGFTVKDFTGVEGEYCLDCGCATSYAFKQKEWTSEDARKWVQKQFKVTKLKDKSPEEIIQESLDKIPDNVFKEWADERKTPEVVTKEFDDISAMIDKDVLKEVLDEVFNPLRNTLERLEA
jgi:hypothetical protein